MLWLQKTPWDKLVPQDFITIMPNPRYNKLDKPVSLPVEMYDEMFLHTYWYISMYMEYRNYGLTPWQVNGGRVIASDVKCLEMMEQMIKDSAEVERRMEGAKQKTEQDIISKYGTQQNQSNPRKKIIYRH